jgi:hypothetical protein
MIQNTYPKPPVDPLHWDKLSRLHPSDVCNRTEALYNRIQEGFLLPVYNLRYLILPKTREILRVEWNDQTVEERLHPFFTLMVLVYLNEAKESGPSHQWVSEKDLKGGINFFQGPHSLQVRELEDLYGKDPEAFSRAGKRLGGTEIFYGNKAIALKVFPRIPLAYLLWEGSEEFPPKIRVLFDSTIQSHLPLDVIWCMVAETSRRLAGPTIL